MRQIGPGIGVSFCPSNERLRLRAKTRTPDSTLLHLRLIGKLVVDFFFVLTFFARCYGWGAANEYWLEMGVF